MGTVFHGRFHLARGPITNTIELVKQAGVTVYGAELDETAVPVNAHGANPRWALVLGNEDEGVSPAVRRCCDQLVMIEQASGDSLNVGHAAAICLFELGRATLRTHDGTGACA